MKHNGTILHNKDGYDVIDCNECGFKHINPIPSNEELDKLYANDFYSKDKPTYFKNNAEEDKDWWKTINDNYYDLFEEHLPEGSKSVIDIGCGPGTFLSHGTKRDWYTVGIEPALDAVNYCTEQNLEVYHSFLDEHTHKILGTYDVVNMRKVLEHIPNPIEFIQNAKSLLKPNGLICVTVPNDYNPLQMMAVEDEQWWVSIPHHINYFSFDSIQKLLENAGFKIIVKEADFPLEFFLLMGDNYVKDSKLGKQCHLKRTKFEETIYNTELRKGLYKSFAENNIGRDIIMIGQLR